jgi:3-hydroxyacyl-CoA dehydrogenase/3-hydroxy-2-methylbutyryl-CoA dehydrogenase
MQFGCVGCATVEIAGKSALVAGGASGLGEATARTLIAAGTTVTIADLNTEKGEALAAELGPGATFVQADVTDEAAVSAAVERAAAHDDGLRISVCCAGIGWAERVAHKGGPHNLEFFSNVVKVNLIGSFNVLRFAAAAMSENKAEAEGERGVCVNTASIAAYDGQIGQIAYAASKGGIVGMTLPAARDMASRGVRVVTIAPGLFDTPCWRRCPRRRAPRSAKASPSPPASAAPRSTAGSSPRSSPTRCSTARRSASTAPCGCRRSNRAPRNVDFPCATWEIDVSYLLAGAFGLGVAPDALAPRRVDGEVGV